MATVARSSANPVTDATEYLRCARHCEDLLKRLRGRQDLCDVVLIVADSGKRIYSHRWVLIASSDYFDSLLSGPMRESQEREIILNEVDGDSLEQLVNFCYTGSLELRVDTINTLLTTANYLQFKEITEGCCEFLQRNIQPSNCLSVAFLAEQLNLEALLHNAKKLIRENFEKVCSHPEFFLLTAKQLSEFLASDDLNVPSEEFVFGVLTKWIEYEPEHRRKHFTDLLALVRLHLLAPTFLVEEVEPLCKTLESQTFVMKALKSHILLKSNYTQLRNYQSQSAVKHFLAIYSRHNHLVIAGYNLHTRVWSKWNTPIEFRLRFAAALMDDNLIMVGGSLNGSPVNTVNSLNLRTMVSTEMAPLTTSRYKPMVAIANGSIYAIGGYSRGKTLYTVERWDSASRTWSFAAPMKDARHISGAAVINDRLYVSGGYCRNRTVLTSVECYDPVENTWSYTAPMKVARKLHCLAAHKGFLFAIGGRNSAGADCPCERYDRRTDSWTTIPCSPEINGYTKCTALGSDLFIVNKSNIYMLDSESTCDNLKLHKIPQCRITLFLISSEWVIIPWELSLPGSWIKK